MTYCIGLCLKDGLVFLSDTRTNAGVDQIGTFRKMTLFQKDKDRFFALMSSGNLAITQSVKEILLQGQLINGKNIWTAKNSYEAAVVIGEAIKQVHKRDHEALHQAGLDFNCNMIFGGQVKGEKPRLFNIYSAGNFIEATPETCYFQIGESKYGKPILDRVLNYSTPLNLATKCALISMDSTLKSNISVGLPLDMVVYEKDSLTATKLVTLDDENPYFAMIHRLWGEKLREAFNSIAEPSWSGANKSTAISMPAKKIVSVPINRPTSKKVGAKVRPTAATKRAKTTSKKKTN
jgi:putative proteasome-type protease